MKRLTNDSNVPYQTIDATARLTGLSRDYIRRGVKAGQIPFIRASASGNSAYMVNVPLFLEQLESESTANMAKPEAVI
jgi:hypothetical protein